jgi:hypothetical protein
VDHVRDEFYISRWIYTRGWDEDFIIALKLLEDQYLYSKIKHRDEYIRFFDVLPYEKALSIQKESLDKRYAMIKQELIDWPSDSVRKTFRIELWTPWEYADKINNIIHKLQKDEKILHLIDELYESFETLIQK